MRTLTEAGQKYVEDIRRFVGKAYSQKRIPADRLQKIEDVLQSLQPLLVEESVSVEGKVEIRQQTHSVVRSTGDLRRRSTNLKVPTAV